MKHFKLLLCIIYCLGITNGLLGQSPPPSPEDLRAEAAAALQLETREGYRTAARIYDKLDSIDAAINTFDLVRNDADGNLIRDTLTLSVMIEYGGLLRARRDNKGCFRVNEVGAKLADELLPEDEYQRARYYSRAGNSAFYAAKSDVAKRYLQHSYKLFTAAGKMDTIDLVNGLRLLVNLASDDNNADLVRSATRRGDEILRAYSGKNPFLVIYSYTDFSLGATRLEDFDEAAEYLNQARRWNQKVGSKPAEVVIHNVAGIFFKNKGDYKSAIEQYNEGLRKVNLGYDRPGRQSFFQTNLARVYLLDGQPEKARKAILASIKGAAEEDKEEFSSSARALLGQIYTALKEYPAAAEQYDLAIQAVSRGNTYREGGILHAVLDSVRYPLEVQEVYEFRAEDMAKAGKPLVALANYEKLFEIHSRERRNFVSDGSQYYQSSANRRHYEGAMKLCLDQYYLTGDAEFLWLGFDLSERTRAYTLLNTIRRNTMGMTDEERTLRESIAEAERSGSNDVASTDKLDKARLQLATLLQEGELVRIKPADPASARKEITNYLNASGMTLISYFLTKAGPRYRYVIDPEGNINVDSLSRSFPLVTKVSAWRELLESSAYIKKSLRQEEQQAELDVSFARVNEGLGTYLLPDWESPPAALCIIPDGVLNSLAFSTLPVAGDLAQPQGEANYLGLSTHLSSAYSAGLLVEIERNKVDAFSTNLLAFAPTFSGTANPEEVLASRGGSLRNGNNRTGPELAPLKYTQEEVRDLQRIVANSESFVGAEANIENFKSRIGSTQILHLATHGVSNLTEPQRSFLAFTPLAGAGQANKDYLFLADIGLLPLLSELVVLSACETNVGKIVTGENVLSLSSAFMAAGSKSTLSTLWQIDDKATSLMMTAFYRALNTGATRAEALQDAQREMIASGDYSHPFYWSGMILNGEAGPVELASNKASAPWWLYALAALAFTGMLWFAFGRK